MSLIKGFCPKCNSTYCGWALTNSFHQKCEECGSVLEISDEREHIQSRYNAFKYPKYKINIDKTKERIMAN
jgi:Fe2+ or Zn2+ uptake regulation protein